MTTRSGSEARRRRYQAAVRLSSEELAALREASTREGVSFGEVLRQSFVESGITREAIRSIAEMKITCPVHGVPDCSPLLNGCSVPNYLHDWREVLLAALRGDF